VNALLKIQKQERRSFPFKIAGWAQVALFGWMALVSNHSQSIQSTYSPEPEYIAAGGGLDRLGDSTAPSNSGGVNQDSRKSRGEAFHRKDHKVAKPLCGSKVPFNRAGASESIS